MKKLCLFLLVNVFVFNCFSQTKRDKLLDKLITDIDTSDMQLLIKKHYITETDKLLLASYMIKKVPGNKRKNITVGEMLAGFAREKNKHNHEIALKYNYGKDSVFIRMPNGDKVFMGLGKLSLEKLVARETTGLPHHYAGYYDLKINSVDNAKKLAETIAGNDQNWLLGSIVIIERDTKKLKDLRIGDILLISRKVAMSAEFIPFAHGLSR
jgi:hypothetical protein